MKNIWEIALPLDPRWYQIVILISLIVYGLLFLNIDIRVHHAAAIIIIAQVTQYLCSKYWHLPRFDPRSALISSLSLCLLLRSDSIMLAVLAAVIAVSSKFIFTFNHRHIFNPTNFALVILLVISDAVWVSSGQWGSTLFFGFLIACMGSLVLNRTARSDITIVFLTTYAVILLGRAWWLGDPISIPLHYLQNGAVLIFAFFMLSDPMTIPESRIGRIAFAAWVAVLSIYIQFGLYQSNALLWALVISSPAVPIINRIAAGQRYHWSMMRKTQ